MSLPLRDVVPRLAVEAALMEAARCGASSSLRVIPEYPQFREAHLDVILHVKPSLHVFQWELPTVFPIHDLQHIMQPEFSEVSARGEYRRREFLYRNAIHASRAVLADSEVGREDILRIYAPPPEKVHALPLLAAPTLDKPIPAEAVARVRRTYSLPDAFIFYPAAFWRHKNHAGLIWALSILNRRHGLRVPLLLSGGQKGDYPRIVRLVDELGLSASVRFLGYLPDEDLYPLYGAATALVMPTFFGPSNIPNIEAWKIGCPLITSDVRGLREQVGDAGVLVDPRDPERLAEAIRRVWLSPELRRELVARGLERVGRWTPAMFARRLAGILETSA